MLKQSKLVVNHDKSINYKKLNLLLRKGFFPFELATSISRLKSITDFPPEEDFEIDGVSILPENYNHARLVWQTFKIKSLYDYAEVMVNKRILNDNILNFIIVIILALLSHRFLFVS